MSLQYYDFSIAVNTKREISAQGRYIYYYSGTTPLITAGTPSAAGNQRIKVTPSGGGAAVLLMPGQNYRIPDSDKQPSTWKIESYNNLETITGIVQAGDGDFGDDNINAAVTLASTAVLNSAALPVQKQAWATITTFAPVVINTGAAQALVSDATQRCLRIRNTHATATLYIGDSTVTAANGALAIGPGQMWVEDEAAGAVWYATSDTGGTTVTIQGLKL